MLDHIHGTLERKSLTEVVVETGGIAYRLHIPLSTFETIPASGKVRLLTYLHVREDQLKLFGFATQAERQMFERLTSVSGIGPTVALTILSGSSIPELKRAVMSADAAFLSRIRGVGKKTAERLIVELKDSIHQIGEPEGIAPAPIYDSRMEDVISALLSLGYTRAPAEKAATAARKKLGDDASVEAFVKEALKHAK